MNERLQAVDRALLAVRVAHRAMLAAQRSLDEALAGVRQAPGSSARLTAARCDAAFQSFLRKATGGRR